MAGFFAWLASSAKFVAVREKGIEPVYGSWTNHPKVGQWYPRDDGPSPVGVYRCLGCGTLAQRNWLTETSQPAEQDACNVLMEKYS